MHASTEKASHEAWLEAWTELKGGRFTYQIVSERGSEAVRGKVLRAMLEREADLVNSGNVAKGDLTPQNYEFSEASRDADGTRVVQLKPKRNDPLLVEGRAVLNDGGDLVRYASGDRQKDIWILSPRDLSGLCQWHCTRPAVIVGHLSGGVTVAFASRDQWY